MPVRRTAPLGLAAALVSLAAPAVASAAAVAPAQKCALAGTPSLGLATSGWVPGSALTIKLGRYAHGATADGAGNFTTAGNPLTAPLLPRPGVKTFKLSVTDGTTVAGPVRTKVVARGVRVPGTAKPSSVVRYRAYGFPSHQRLYLHVRRGGSTKGSFRLGRPSGACGLLERKLRYMPLRHWSNGNYDYWFSNTSHYRKSKRLYGYRIHIYSRMK